MSIFEVRIVTPQETAFSGEAVHLSAKNPEGYFGIKARHAPFITILDVCRLSVDMPNETRKDFALDGGCLEFSKNKCTILADSLEQRENIDVENVKRERDEYKMRLQTVKDAMEKTRTERALRKAVNRIKVASESRN